MSGHAVWIGGEEWEVLDPDDGGGYVHPACGEYVRGEDARYDHVCPDVRANDLANQIADEEMDRLEAATDQGPETRECPWCYGKGEIGTDRDSFGNWNTKPCWRCRGTGEIDL